ncbi:MAG: hypothetical protein ACRD90_00520 [Nitrosopumilaceae archaeon]
MKITAFSISIILLTGILSSAIGVSNAEPIQLKNELTVTNQADTESNQNERSEQDISSIVHEAILLFKQQREETITTIKKCQEKIQNTSPENRQQVRDDCRTSLNEIKEFYKEMRGQIRELIQENRDNVKALIKETKASLARESMMIHDESDTEDADESDTEDDKK